MHKQATASPPLLAPGRVGNRPQNCSGQSEHKIRPIGRRQQSLVHTAHSYVAKNQVEMGGIFHAGILFHKVYIFTIFALLEKSIQS